MERLVGDRPHPSWLAGHHGQIVKHVVSAAQGVGTGIPEHREIGLFAAGLRRPARRRHSKTVGNAHFHAARRLVHGGDQRLGERQRIVIHAQPTHGNVLTTEHRQATPIPSQEQCRPRTVDDDVLLPLEPDDVSRAGSDPISASGVKTQHRRLRRGHPRRDGLLQCLCIIGRAVAGRFVISDAHHGRRQNGGLRRTRRSQ